MKYFISTQHLSVNDVKDLAEQALKLSSLSSFSPILAGKIVALAFFQPSTRTRLGCEVAVIRLGGNCIHLGDNSSLLKGESFEDTISTLAEFADCIVIRHPEEGAAEKAAKLVDISVVNGGDGRNELPMGGLLLFYQLYCYAIRRGKEVNELSVLFYGSLKYSRACHSLILILGKFGVKMLCACPDGLGLPEKYMMWIKDEGAVLEYIDSEIDLSQRDVLLIPEVAAHKRELYKPAEFSEVEHFYKQITKEFLDRLRSDALIMSVPPLAWEIPKELDGDPRQVYTKIPIDGMYTKMAVFASLLAPSQQGNGQ